MPVPIFSIKSAAFYKTRVHPLPPATNFADIADASRFDTEKSLDVVNRVVGRFFKIDAFA
jgi:hypothetical protein